MSYNLSSNSIFSCVIVARQGERCLQGVLPSMAKKCDLNWGTMDPDLYECFGGHLLRLHNISCWPWNCSTEMI